MNILIVDDNDDARYILRKTLAAAGHRVTEAENGKAALALARQAPPGLIISDILMPEMDGFRFCRQVRMDEALVHTPFVFYTATYTDDSDEQLALELGADRFIRKPLDGPAFLDAIRNVTRAADQGELKGAEMELGHETAFLKRYNSRLIQKLEKKMADLEEEVATRKEAQARLEESERRYRALVENIPQRVVLKDLQSRYLSVNKAVERYWGRPAEEIVGKTDHDLFPQEAAARNVQEDWSVTEKGAVKEFFQEEVIDGQKRYKHKVKVPVKDGSGKVTGVLTTVSDITERVALEEQFLHAQKMEAVGLLAGGVAHDFNNLLTVIGGYAGLCLGMADAGGPLHDNLLEIKTAAERASRLTRQLLAFSRRQVMSFANLNVNTIILEMRKMLQRLLGEDVRVVERLAADLGCVRADPGQIEQVILNLAVNARDAMPGGGRLVIATANLDLAEGDTPPISGLKPGRYVLLSVSDTG